MNNAAQPKEASATQIKKGAITGTTGYGSPPDNAALPDDNTLNFVDEDEKEGARGDVATE